MVNLVLLTRRLYIWNVSKPRRAWKYSPDSSGYAARSVDYEAFAAAFERIAGNPLLNCFIVSLLKKVQLFKCQVKSYAQATEATFGFPFHFALGEDKPLPLSSYFTKNVWHFQKSKPGKKVHQNLLSN